MHLLRPQSLRFACPQPTSRGSRRRAANRAGISAMAPRKWMPAVHRPGGQDRRWRTRCNATLSCPGVHHPLDTTPGRFSGSENDICCELGRRILPVPRDYVLRRDRRGGEPGKCRGSRGIAGYLPRVGPPVLTAARGPGDSVRVWLCTWLLFWLKIAMRRGGERDSEPGMRHDWLGRDRR